MCRREVQEDDKAQRNGDTDQRRNEGEGPVRVGQAAKPHKSDEEESGNHVREGHGDRLDPAAKEAEIGRLGEEIRIGQPLEENEGRQNGEMHDVAIRVLRSTLHPAMRGQGAAKHPAARRAKIQIGVEIARRAVKRVA